MAESLHICFVSQEYPPDTGWGGIGSYTYDMAHALVECGHRVTVIARAAGDECVVDDRGVAVHRIKPSPCWNDFRVVWRLNRVWPGFAWAATSRLRSIHRSAPVDIVESAECRADAFFITLLPQPRPRIVIRLHLAWIFVDLQNGVSPDWKKRLIYWLEKQAILRCDAVTAPSAAVVQLTRTWLPNLAARVIPNPIDTDTFANGAMDRRLEILFVGRLERRKGIETLALAAPMILARSAGASLRFIGADGVDEQGHSWRSRVLQRIAPDEHARVAFEQVSRTELAERYGRAAMCVVPSEWENFPYVALEAMASGTPVVASRAGGLPEIVEDGKTGILVLARDPEALANAVSGLCSDPRKLEQMGAQARLSAEKRFSTAVIVDQMVDFYRALAVSPTSSASGIAARAQTEVHE